MPSECVCTSVSDNPVQRAKGLDAENSGSELGPSMTWRESLHLLGSLCLYLWCEELGLDSPRARLSLIMFLDPTWTL